MKKNNSDCQFSINELYLLRPLLSKIKKKSISDKMYSEQCRNMAQESKAKCHNVCHGACPSHNDTVRLELRTAGHVKRQYNILITITQAVALIHQQTQSTEKTGAPMYYHYVLAQLGTCLFYTLNIV